VKPMQDDLWYGDSNDLKLKLHNVFRDYTVFPEVLNVIIISYCFWPEWETNASITWSVVDKPYGILCHQQEIYACFPDINLITKYNLKGETLEKNTVHGAAGIDIDINNSLVYIAGRTEVMLLHLKNKTSLSSWALPVDNRYRFRGIKVDGDILYLTLFDVQQIFLCHSNDGKVLNKFGNTRASSKEGEFNDPHGVTVNMKYLYVCDNNNNRIQVLTKDKGIFFSQWGNKTTKDQLVSPFSVFYDELEMLFYIGDQGSVSVYASDTRTGNGYCIQRFGSLGSQMDEFECVVGFCRINDRLYVSDCENNRIQIFQRKQ